MSYAVLHVSKLSGGGGGGIGAHIDRKHTPKNADPERKHLNKELIEPRSPSMKKDIDERIKEGYTSSRKIRKDAVKAVGIILSGSHERMKKIEKDGRLDEWCQDNIKFVEKRFGKENLIRCTLHMDEKTPHLHVVFTPITEDGRLHFKTFLDGKKDLTKLQDDYGKEMGKYGLKRGLEQSRAKHTTTREYYAKLENVPPIEIKTGVLGRPKEGENERITEEFKRMTAAVIEQKRLADSSKRETEIEKKKSGKSSYELDRIRTETTAQIKEVRAEVEKEKANTNAIFRHLKTALKGEDTQTIEALKEHFKINQKPSQDRGKGISK